jgi:hypothetical protein
MAAQLGGAGFTARAQAPLDATRATLEQWVQTRQTIAQTARDWKTDQESLQQTLALLQRELQLLDDQITQQGEAAGAKRTEQQQLREQNETLLAASREIAGAMGELEAHLLKISKAFPRPLLEKIEPLFRRIPQRPEAAALPLSQRLQNVLGIMNEVEKFHGSITLATELRKSRTGEEFQVKALYIGLAQAYFVDKGGSNAGVGAPAIGGWHWADRNELAPQITRAIAIYENDIPAAFVTLPVQIK